MSVTYCEYCRKQIDTDFDAEHFVPDTEYCLIQVEEAAPRMLKALLLIEKHAPEMGGDWALMKAQEALKDLS